MKCVVQRVSKANVRINGKIEGEIGKGILVLLGVKGTDSHDKIDWIIHKLVNLRIFEDENNKMNLSLIDVEGEILVVSNFTIYADAQKGLRPSYSEAASPDIALPIYNEFITRLQKLYTNKVATGIFGEMMEVELTNDGPVTIILEK